MKKNTNTTVVAMVGLFVLLVVLIIALRGPNNIPMDSQTARSCLRANPTVTTSPVVSSGYTGQLVSYQVYVKNNDSSGCGETRFTFPFSGPNYLGPARMWLTSINDIILKPGKYTMVPFTVSAPIGTPSGSYALIMRVVNMSSGGAMSTDANPVTLTINPISDSQAPSAPSSATIFASSSTVSGMRWNSSSDNTGISVYEIYNGATKIGQVYPGSGNQFVAERLSPSTPYTFTIKARDYAGNLSSGSNVSVTTAATANTTAPSAPTNVTVTNVTATTATINWTPGYGHSWMQGYIVGEKNTGVSYTMPVTLCASATSCSYTVKGLGSGTKYYFRVLTIDVSGNRNATNYVSLTTLN